MTVQIYILNMLNDGPTKLKNFQNCLTATDRKEKANKPNKNTTKEITN